MKASSQRARLQARLLEIRARKTYRRRRAAGIAVLVAVILVLLLSRCACTPDEPLVPEATPHTPTPTMTASATPSPRPTPRSTKVQKPGPIPSARLGRASFGAGVDTKIPWLARFRRQAGARTPRLVQCLETATPGALRWTVRVDPKTGRLGEHVIEPVGNTLALSATQESCFLKVLSDPPFELRDETTPGNGQKEKLPERVVLVFEF